MLNYNPPSNLLAERIILITGAGDGIGRVVAQACAAHGATVILLGRTIRKLEEVYDQIEKAGHPQPAIYPMNLEGATPKDYEDLAETLLNEFGRLDGLLHNAAILGNMSPLELFDVTQWYQVMQVNLNAPFLLTRACLPLLKKSTDASLLFTSADVGVRGKAYWGAYSVAKFGIVGMMQILAAELEANTSVRVNALNPVVVRTGLRTSAYPGENPHTLPTPESIVKWYLYLLSGDSHGITGQHFNVQTDTLPHLV